MFNIFDLIGLISEIIEEKNEKLGHLISTIAGHIFMILITGGLWIFVELFMMRRRRKNRKRA